LSASGGNQYLWTPSNLLSSLNGSLVTISPISTTTFFLNGTDSIGCQNNDSITITVNPLPTINFIDDLITICDKDSAAILMTLSGNFPFSLVYSIDQVINDNILEIITNTSYLPTNQEGLYEVITVTDINGCVNSSDDEIFVEVLNIPISSFNHNINDDDIFQSQISFINNSQFANNYTWYFGDPPYNGFSSLENPTYTYNFPGYYDVTLIAENGPCVKDTTYEIYIKPVYSLYLPSSFTPNGDKLNDYFPWDPCCVTGNNFSNFEIFIYNKWGSLVFYSKDKLSVWDGSVNNNGEIYTGNYSYIIKIIDDIGESHTITGNVIIN
jgi:gliding motility-associated-like protein